MNYLFIISTASCVLEILIPIITKFLTDRISVENESDRLLRKDLISIKRQMGDISMVDEFAKFAKLQRRYNKLESELSIRGTRHKMNRKFVQCSDDVENEIGTLSHLQFENPKCHCNRGFTVPIPLGTGCYFTKRRTLACAEYPQLAMFPGKFYIANNVAYDIESCYVKL